MLMSLQRQLYTGFYDMELLVSGIVLVMVFCALEITTFSCMRRQEQYLLYLYLK